MMAFGEVAQKYPIKIRYFYDIWLPEPEYAVLCIGQSIAFLRITRIRLTVSMVGLTSPSLLS